VHDFMHAKVTVCDDTVFVGSFNLSRSGEQNAENVLEIKDAELADRLAAFVDEVRAKYGPVQLPSPDELVQHRRRWFERLRRRRRRRSPAVAVDQVGQVPPTRPQP